MDPILEATMLLLVADKHARTEIEKQVCEINENLARCRSDYDKALARMNVVAKLALLALGTSDKKLAQALGQKIKFASKELDRSTKKVNMWLEKKDALREHYRQILDTNETVAALKAYLPKEHPPKCNEKSEPIVSPSKKPLQQPIKKESKCYTKPEPEPVMVPLKEPEFAQINLVCNEQPKPDTGNAHTLIKVSKFKYEYLVGPSSTIDRKIQNHDIVFHEQLDAISDDFQNYIDTQMKDKVGKHIRQLKNGFTYKPNSSIELDEIIAIYAGSQA